MGNIRILQKLAYKVIHCSGLGYDTVAKDLGFSVNYLKKLIFGTDEKTLSKNTFKRLFDYFEDKGVYSHNSDDERIYTIKPDSVKEFAGWIKKGFKLRNPELGKVLGMSTRSIQKACRDDSFDYKEVSRLIEFAKSNGVILSPDFLIYQEAGS